MTLASSFDLNEKLSMLDPSLPGMATLRDPSLPDMATMCDPSLTGHEAGSRWGPP